MEPSFPGNPAMAGTPTVLGTQGSDECCLDQDYQAEMSHCHQNGGEGEDELGSCCGEGHHHDQDEDEALQNQKEREHFEEVINAFNFYRTHIMRRINRAEHDFELMSLRHQSLVPSFSSNMKLLRAAVEENYSLIKEITKPHQLFVNRDIMDTDYEISAGHQPDASAFNMDKVRSTIKQFVRDWSEEGQAERVVCYQPMINELKSRYPIESRSSVRVLVPGCGLGRLAYEFARLGFTSQGNECSYFMLIASNYILNRATMQQMAIHPWVHQFSNHMTKDDQRRAILVPDINPANTLPKGSDFSMTAGDFIDCYKTAESWDAVCTCFFLDTARNIIEYIETLYHILTPGGVWTNFGPLLYHYADMNEPSLEISYEEVRAIIEKVGFVIK
eukprot:Ihof_evm13s51 gene=Ihof_evmTU13s51